MKEKAAKKPGVLVCDDNQLFREAVKVALAERYEVTTVTDAEQAVALLRTRRVDVVLLDVQMRTPDEGLRYIPLLKKEDPDVAIIMSSGISDFETVREAMKQGAVDYVPKSASYLDLTLSLERVTRLREERLRRQQQNSEVMGYHNRHVLIGRHPLMESLRRTIDKVRASSSNVVILGEPGVGKEVVARLLRGAAADGSLVPFVSVDSSTIQSATAESLLFGHEKGAFTGADRMHKGLFEEANGGIIYFDEIGNMPLDIQAKLLRVIQEKEIVRMGSSRSLPLEFRVICATNQDMEKMVERHEFRFDLLSRLNVIPMKIPALRERREDIPLLVEYFVEKHGKRARFTPEALECMARYSWPGNVRELSNLVAYVITMTEGEEVDVLDLPPKLLQAAPASAAEPEGSLYDRVKAFEKEVLTSELAKAKTVAELARKLGMDRSHLYAKLKSYGIQAGKT
jgi:DNA-binding NtrC family response regulator